MDKTPENWSAAHCVSASCNDSDDRERTASLLDALTRALDPELAGELLNIVRTKGEENTAVVIFAHYSDVAASRVTFVTHCVIT